ncbi:DHA3 family tetracycline resistance protein-like MFS transporter [Allocatelliglobosispora scoriae]|uniref:DHA3 family tetracycline resistance protein-like MFS transporter n=1 Tax=Allocatelliglobosispora scoriae TaxID=643052 RepID=A0A841C680_9ACTN|nr:MFS transporter [Allocatelliglobosispora scoriae]MBB5874440.1 DHA3 family tetracycline resistance protein-like MFS transporter [Allocatelliglobosispora scoriae]
MSAYRLYLVIYGVGAFAANTAFTLNLVYQSQVVGLGPLQLVLVGTLMEVVCFVAQVPTGVIADLYSRRLSIIVGYALMGAGLLLWGLLPSFTAILVANAVWAVGAVCVDGAEEAWAADEIGEERIGRAFVRGGQIGQVGTLLGIVAAVGLGSLDLALPIVVGAVVTLGLVGLLAAVMPERGWAPTPAPQRTTLHSMRAQVVLGGRTVRRSAMLLGLVAGTLFIGMGSEGFDRLSQPHFLADLSLPAGLSPQVWFGVFAVVAAFGSIVVTGLLGRRIDTLAPRQVGVVLTVTQAVAAAGMIWFGLAGSFWPAVGAYLVVTLMRDATRPVLNLLMVAATTSRSRATVFSIQSQVDALGQIAGGPPAGYAGQRRSMGAGIATSGLFVVPAVVLFALVASRFARTPAGQPLTAETAETSASGAR